MPYAILKQILEQLQSLEPAELQQLNQAVQDHLVNQKETANINLINVCNMSLSTSPCQGEAGRGLVCSI
jgi:hypothetical protein